MELKDITPIVAAQSGLAPMPLVTLKTREALDDFFKQTHAWRHEVNVMGMPPMLDNIKLPAPGDSKVCAVFKVWLGPNLLSEKQWNFINERLDFHYIDLPGWDGLLRAKVALTIDGRNPEFPGWIEPEVIANGALAKLFAIPGQPWANPEMAAYFDTEFRRGIANKRIELKHGGRPGSLRIKHPRFGE